MVTDELDASGNSAKVGTSYQSPRLCFKCVINAKLLKLHSIPSDVKKDDESDAHHFDDTRGICLRESIE